MIAAVLESFPETTQTFHHHRLAELHRRGLLDSIWYVRPASGTLPSGCEDLLDVAEQIPTPTVADFARFATSSTLRDCLLYPTQDNGERGRLGALKYAAYGAALAGQLSARPQVSRVHAMFAAASATTAVTAASLTKLALSIEFHSPQSLRVNPRWLAAKLERADDIVAISEYSAAEVRRLAPDSDIHIVRCGIPALETTGQPNGDDSIDLLAVGSLIPKKGHETTIAAAAELDRHLTIVGAGPLRHDLEGLARRLGAKVDFRGSMSSDDVRKLMGYAAVGVLGCTRTAAGDEDGIPVALMEFLQAGLPTVSTRIAGIPELLAEERIGLIVEPDDPSALAAAITRAESLVDGRDSRLPPEFQLTQSCDSLADALGFSFEAST